MRNSALIFLLCLLIASCATRTPLQSVPNETPIDNQFKDGTSFEQAISVGSIREEYEWVRTRHPGSQMNMQRLVFHEKKPYDVLTFVMTDGSKRDFYFDISRFYGKGF
jgi:hypothetical protein